VTSIRLRMKRVYDTPEKADGRRILVDRLWPRGLSKSRAAVDHWARSIAPSTELRRWYAHEATRWDEFRARYAAELDANPEGVTELRAALAPGINTFLFSSKELQLNNARALIEYLERK